MGLETHFRGYTSYQGGRSFRETVRTILRHCLAKELGNQAADWQISNFFQQVGAREDDFFAEVDADPLRKPAVTRPAFYLLCQAGYAGTFDDLWRSATDGAAMIEQLISRPKVHSCVASIRRSQKPAVRRTCNGQTQRERVFDLLRISLASQSGNRVSMQHARAYLKSCGIDPTLFILRASKDWSQDTEASRSLYQLLRQAGFRGTFQDMWMLILNCRPPYAENSPSAVRMGPTNRTFVHKGIGQTKKPGSHSNNN